MVLANQPLHIHRSPAHLLPVDRTNQRLLDASFFLAHAHRLPGSILLSMNLEGFFTRSNHKSRAPTCWTSFPVSTDVQGPVFSNGPNELFGKLDSIPPPIYSPFVN